MIMVTCIMSAVISVLKGTTREVTTAEEFESYIDRCILRSINDYVLSSTPHNYIYFKCKKAS